MCTICGKYLSDKTSLKNHIQSHETGRWKVEHLPNTVEFYPDAEFEDLSNDPKFPSKSWNYFLYNKETKDAKCRFCGSLVHVDKGKYSITNHSSEIRGLRSTKYSSKTLQNLLYFMYKKTHIVFFVFHFVQL